MSKHMLGPQKSEKSKLTCRISGGDSLSYTTSFLPLVPMIADHQLQTKGSCPDFSIAHASVLYLDSLHKWQLPWVHKHLIGSKSKVFRLNSASRPCG